MKMPRVLKNAVHLAAVLSFGGIFATGAICDEVDGKPLVVFLVRHGEKADRSADAQLSAAGRERARQLAQTLRSAGIEHVHSTDFVRTIKTATPTANQHGLEMEIYDHSDLSTLAEKLRSAGGRHLVVGHSNTTPELVELLGAEPGSAIDEEDEFDRLYVVMIAADGTVNGVLMRYGEAYIARADD